MAPPGGDLSWERRVPSAEAIPERAPRNLCGARAGARRAARLYVDANDQRVLLPISSSIGCAYRGVRTCKYDGRVVARRGGLELQGGYDWLGDGRLDKLLGIDVRLRSVGSKQDIFDQDTGAPSIDSFGIVDESDHTLGAYAQQIWLPLPILALNAGARHLLASLPRAGFLPERIWRQLAGSLERAAAGEGDFEREPLPTAARFKGNAHLSYDLGQALPTFALAGYVLSSRLADRGLHSGFQPTPYAPTQLDLRATATGWVPGLRGLSYRSSLDRVFGTSGPCAIGSLLAATPEHPSAELSPLAPWRFTAGVEYGFGEE